MNDNSNSGLMNRLNEANNLCACPSVFTAEFAHAIAKLSPARLARINPIAFAEEAGLDKENTLDIFIAGARTGLFSFEWGLVCPSCGTFANNSHTISELAPDFHCAFCDKDVSSSLDDTVEVTFAMDEKHSGRFNRHENFTSNFRYFVSPGYLRYDGWLDFHRRNTLAQDSVGIGEQATLEFSPQAGDIIRLYCIDLHASITLKVSEPSVTKQVQMLSYSLSEKGFNKTGGLIEASATQLQISNLSDERIWVQAIRMVIPEIKSLISLPPPVFAPHLTGQRLLTNQMFRDQFGMERLIPDLRLRVKTVCLLFTDLKGSTDLYDRTGDLEAYNLVQNTLRFYGLPCASIPAQSSKQWVIPSWPLSPTPKVACEPRLICCSAWNSFRTKLNLKCWG